MQYFISLATLILMMLQRHPERIKEKEKEREREREREREHYIF